MTPDAPTVGADKEKIVPHSPRTSTRERLRSRVIVASVAALATAAAGLLAAAPASAATTTLAPTSLTTTAGAIGSGQTVSALAVKDHTGTQDVWNKYVEFTGAYAGYRTYTVPSSVAPSSVTGIQVSANYRGPAPAQQTWTWSLYNWSTSSWTSVGTNAGAPSWGSWKTLTFASPTAASAFVNSSGSVRVQLKAGNSSDAANLDWESLTVTSSGGSTPTPTPTPTPSTGVTLPPANGGFSYQLGGAYTPESGVSVVSRDRLVAPAGSSFYNICYVNLLQTQPDQAGQSTTNPGYGTTQWWKNSHPDLLLRDGSGNLVIDAGWNEAIFDVRTATKRAQLLEIQKPWFDACKASGYQAIEPDNLDVFLRSKNYLTFAQTRDYLKLVIPYVHSIGLAIGQKNTAETGQGYGGIGKTFVDTVSPAQGFDFAIAEECAAYWECASYTSVYGPLVFEIEYTDNNPNRVHNGTTKTSFQAICADDGASRGIILRDRDVVPAGTAGYSYQSC